ncbi:hypothetical protein CHS0354_039797 [Potamilus streckersoni]|uniref:NACHT domain-containing protein n=1 Tax=Potamilus streckersoni TaxID=2493646 RepID=A0AAE0SRE2_9BIVA|nr:hypothetical protein CHS0354_039797 [Potamilus streckersoni]
MSRVSVCVVIILQFGAVLALSWTSNSSHLNACEHNDVELRWDYKTEPGEYVKAKTWFTGMNKTAKRLAYWKDTDGVTVESDYINRIKMLGNDSFVLKDVKARDEGPYTMIASMPHSSEPDPRKTFNLTIYIAPLKEEGCCKPEIDVRDDTLVAFLPSYQGCGKPPPSLTWVEHRNKKVENGSIYLGKTDREGKYKVCVTSPAIDKCFPGDKKTLCRTHDEIRNVTAHYIRQEGTATRAETIVIPTSVAGAVVVLIVISIVLYMLWKRKEEPLMKAKRKTGKRSKDVADLLNEIANLKFLTTQQIDFYETMLPTSNDDSDVQYEMEIVDEDAPQSDKFNASLYEDIFCKNEITLNRVLLQGYAGCGKRTWCSSFIHTWCQALSEGKKKIKHQNINFMSKFKLLFNVSLRDVTNEKHINELLKRQHIPDFNSLQGDIYTHLETNSDVIFLIQGLDEYTGNADVVKVLLSDKKLEKALIIFTSRPLTQNSFKNKFQIDWPFNRTVTIKGLDKKDLRKRAGEILKEDGHPTKSLDIFFLLAEKKGLGDFMQEPVFFPTLMSMWQNSGILPLCKAEFMLNVLENQIKKKRNSFLRQYRDKTVYYYDFNENSLLIGKVFICHYGLILISLGKIAMELQRDKTNIFGSVQFEEKYRNFCVNVDLICASQVSANDQNEEKFSFRHRSMQLFLVALYITSRPMLEQEENISAIWSNAGGENIVDTRNPENIDNYKDSKGNREYCEVSEYISYLSLTA